MNFLQKTASLAVLSGLALAAAPAHAQINVNINTAPPVVVGAPADAQYYYIPEANAYYDVPARRYLVQRNGQWGRYERLDGYDPRNFHPQYIDYRGDSPWLWKGKGHPHGMPPGQAKKMYRDGYRDGRDYDDDQGRGHGKGHGRDHDRD
ncbi:hypothetical protein GCM10023172_25960 [Hymenobacter ginsengisoli]|uniref:Uncharacterized protein n=1 Tax=Hymenobacter ginsengisoli TaxID=1051626 RepID=A0ABP8QIY5_9BACT|nr:MULTISPECIES: hypothetical protein [unclassified Hymenobacter]MBO2030147.1 hypothetical protein [Hymenobacter sp. BT559]